MEVSVSDTSAIGANPRMNPASASDQWLAILMRRSSKNAGMPRTIMCAALIDQAINAAISGALSPLTNKLIARKGRAGATEANNAEREVLATMFIWALTPELTRAAKRHRVE